MRRKLERKPLDVIWTIPDELWLLIEPILLKDAPPNPTGRPRIDWRDALNGILFRLRTGCQWNKLPKEFGDDSSVHRWFQRWNQHGVMKQIWAVLVERCDELGGVDWDWQSADGAMGKARFGGEKDRAQSHGSRETGRQTQRLDRGSGRSVGRGHRWRQPA